MVEHEVMTRLIRLFRRRRCVVVTRSDNVVPIRRLIYDREVDGE